MGCDGGTIPRRDELVKVKKKPEQKDKDAELAALWKCCAITQDVLQEPIVTCHLGKLYNKMSVIESLLDRTNMPPQFRHIKSLKDVKLLKLTKNPEFKRDEDKKGGSVDHRGSPYICPVLSLEMSGKFRFVAIWNCGCVFSERAYKEIGTKICHKCTEPFEEEDVVILNGTTDEDLQLMTDRMQIRQAKNKKKKKIKSEPSEEVPASGSKRPLGKQQQQQGALKKLKSLSKIGNVISSGKVTKMEEIRKMSAQYSIADDQKASDVYKSLFTSHKSEKEQDRAHWVTYNPFYN
ncbi:replication termination factor 2 [Anthonomus grandis grandis]|uniref:replication termination factor 2 n=1 Tax=Anthonomus grandis grandis TaxID=2921223 RepID=UPI002165A37B|nr:replication termination factor 2 [Anthonomus grandis grandis]